MAHQFLMFLAPDNATTQGLPQATVLKPPANSLRVAALVPAADAEVVSESTPLAAGKRVHTFKFLASVVGNAIGFVALIAACWLCLQA